MATKKVKDSTGPTREAIMAQLRDFALSLPGAFEDFPWDEPVAKVNKKIFVFLGSSPGERRVSFGVKLPESVDEALTFPDSARMGYGLGKHNWVGVYFPAASCPVDLCLEWIEESYRAIAPKTLVKQLDADLRLAPPISL